MPPLDARIRSTHTPDGTIVLDIEHGRMFSLNLAGSTIVQLLERGHSEAEIVEQLVQQFSIAPTVAETDVAEFLKSLEKYSLIARNQNASLE